MTHVYYHPIAVSLVQGMPATIRWRGITYQVLEINEPWHLMDRWWESSAVSGASDASDSGTPQQRQRNRSDRTYYRVRCVSAHEDLTCEIYFDAIGCFWILERVYD